MKKIVKIPGIVILVLVILAFVIRLALPPLALKVANRKLPDLLNTAASIGSIRLRLHRGCFSVNDLRIAQPEGFGEGYLLRVPEVRVKVKLSSLLSSPLTVDEVVLTDWEVNLVKNIEGVMNTEVLMPESSPPPAPSPPPETEVEEEEEVAPKPILVRVFSIENLSFSYLDRAIGKEVAGKTGDGVEREKGEDEEVLLLRIADLDFLLENLLIDPAADREQTEPAEAVITARLIQEPYADGLLGLAARIGPVGGEVPEVNAVLRLADLELETIEAVIPDGTAQVLGGSALDLSADLALASYLLDCEIEVEATGGHVIPLSIGGTPEKPEIDQSSILLGVMTHLGGGVGHLVGNIGGAGYQLAAGATETTWAVGKGAVNVVGSIGGGLFKTVTSAATGDLDGAVEGLSDATVGTAETAADAAVDVAGEVAEGATATVDSTTGEDADREWRADTPRRWKESWAAARKKLEEMPFPPPPREDEPPAEESGESSPGAPLAETVPADSETEASPVGFGTPLDF